MDFWPEGKIDDQHLFMMLNVKDLKMKLGQRQDHKDSELTLAEKRLIEMTSGIDIAANPVIMIVTIK